MKEEIKNTIINLLSDARARDAIEIINYLNYSKDMDSLIMEVINEMVLECDLYMTKKGKYMNFKDSDATKNLYKGYFQATSKEFGFVNISDDQEDIFIPAPYKNSALDGDLVLVNVINENKREGRIVKVLKRNPKVKIAEVYFKKQKAYCILKNSKNKQEMLLKGDVNRLVDGDIIAVSVIEDTTKAVAKFEKHIGHKNDPGIDIISILAEHNFDTVFPLEVLEELKTIKTEVEPEELLDRTDLRDEEIFTIDGDDTKDIDDAISLKILANGNYELGVHIADVSYYVKENSSLDLEARKRGTSVYLADRVVPMLPHQLSNGICSLNPLVDRLTLSCVSEIDSKGNIKDYKIFKSVINSKKQMTYKKVNQILEENIIPEGYEPFVETLTKMAKLAEILRQNKIQKGYIDFDVLEPKIIVDDEGKAIDVVPRTRGVGENLIEDFMIVANECVATYIYNMNLPGIYRVHGKVNVDKLRKFVNSLDILGIRIKENLNNVTQKTIQRIIKEFKNHEAYQILSNQMISCMDKAKYQTNNIGHFALGLRNYTHFTSPIRRYPDTTTHRLLHEYFFSNDGITPEKINHFTNLLDEVCLTSSERERASMECEREVDDMKMAEYMESHLGETYQGMVSGITSYGMYVMLTDKLIEGLVRIDSLGEECVYDESIGLVLKSSKTVYSLGSKVTVKVLNASKETRKIDFIIVEGEKDAD